MRLPKKPVEIRAAMDAIRKRHREGACWLCGKASSKGATRCRECLFGNRTNAEIETFYALSSLLTNKL